MSDYRAIVAHYEACLATYGDTHRGVDWPNQEDAAKRYDVMLDLIAPVTAGETVSLLDFGCGASHLYDHLKASGRHGIRYSGLDLSQCFVDLSRSKHPENDYWCLDLLEPGADLPTFDYIVMNGVFTEKRELSFEAMFTYFQQLVTRVWDHARRGIAFNVMSKQVDWERDELFHLPLDTLADFLTRELTRRFVIRNDYGLYEYTAYVLKSDAAWPGWSPIEGNHRALRKAERTGGGN